MRKMLFTLAVLAACSQAAHAQFIPCKQILDMPASCSAQLAQMDGKMINLNAGIAQASCTSGTDRLTWVQGLYNYSTSDELVVHRTGFNTSAYPNYSWACPSPAQITRKNAGHLKRMQSDPQYRAMQQEQAAARR